jgi:hypothetical protein
MSIQGVDLLPMERVDEPPITTIGSDGVGVAD